MPKWGLPRQSAVLAAQGWPVHGPIARCVRWLTLCGVIRRGLRPQRAGKRAFCRKDSGDLIRLSTSEDQLLRCHERHAITHVKALRDAPPTDAKGVVQQSTREQSPHGSDFGHCFASWGRDWDGMGWDERAFWNIEVAAWQASGPCPRLQRTSGACSCPLQ